MSVKHKRIRTTVMNRRYFLIGTGTAIASTVIASCTQNQNSSQKISTVKVGITQLVPEDILKFVQKELAPNQICLHRLSQAQRSGLILPSYLLL
ncbi:hypothetical protein [uncultured Nostoc sp.]|uniref:hypothetical protein n=1 Tax=uncultured Nostoc sp. TaxID=340711 RepID=UPI00260DB5AE|nr:hypothetical protein [uncultured Nostoc sp.]